MSDKVVLSEGKITAARIKNHCPFELQKWGACVEAHLEKASKCEEKAEQHRVSAGRYLALAADACDEGGFEAFRKKYCPDIGRSRAFELKAVAAGKKSIEQIKAETCERVARHRARRESVTSGVTDSTKDNFVLPPSSEDPQQQQADQRKAENAARYRAESDAEALSTAAEFKTETLSPPRDHVLEQYFALASGGNILERIRGSKRTDIVIADILDALGVDGVLKAASDEFKRELSAKLGSRSRATMNAVMTGRNAAGEPIFAPERRGGRTRPN